ncbi:hypothetical protein BJ742DRAFT_547582 [Cladochytrium replicatum]|nr:hypothetical protein BJ742DRAFT_547582 [Cladochytrium replicatum]
MIRSGREENGVHIYVRSARVNCIVMRNDRIRAFERMNDESFSPLETSKSTCIASGRPIVEAVHFMYHVCKQPAIGSEITGMLSCPLVSYQSRHDIP